jgi:ankyrin repeat protein
VEACYDKELEEVRWMLQYRELARDTETIDYVLGFARRSCHFALVKCLVEHTDVDVNKMGRVGTLLHDVIWWSERRSDLHDVCLRVYLLSDAADVYRLVYEFGANVNEQDNIGDTPLHIACSSGNQDIVEALMVCGADVNITNDNKQTPAQQAIYHKHEKLIRLLDRTSFMDTHVQRRQQKLTLKTFISVHLTALFVHSINRL